jgi:release factor glutamine methyltransferase
MISLIELLKISVAKLKPHSESPQLDAEILLAHILQKTRSYLYAHPEAIILENQHNDYQQLINQRIIGMPIAYLTGTREFWSLPLKVSCDTLIPRPETELLVELTLELLKNQLHAQILDLGTGTGAIALALAKERPNWNINASDKSLAALKIAEENALLSGLKHVKFFYSDWFTKLPKKQYHAILSNPPYIAENDFHLLQGDVRFEPKMALVSGKDGLDDLTHLVETSCNYLLPGGLLLLEHGYDQKTALESILYNAGYKDVQCWQDLQGNDRVTKATWY